MLPSCLRPFARPLLHPSLPADDTTEQFIRHLRIVPTVQRTHALNFIDRTHVGGLGRIEYSRVGLSICGLCASYFNLLNLLDTGPLFMTGELPFSLSLFEIFRKHLPALRKSGDTPSIISQRRVISRTPDLTREQPSVHVFTAINWL